MTPPSAKPILLTTVFITGMAVLIVEIPAIRILSPYFGTSMFVLSSVLTVILAALALGYFWGGRLADRYPHPLPLYGILAIGGFTIALSFALSTIVIPFLSSFIPITYGPLLLAFVFFFIPAFLLGTDSPYVIKLLTKDADPATAGAITGNTFFFSTVGSIIGSLSAGFFFIPFVGIEATLLGVACVLAVGAATAAHFLTGRTEMAPETSPIRLCHLYIIALGTILLTVLTLSLPPQSLDKENQTTLYEAQGYYGHIRVYEQEFSLVRPPARFLRREVNAESAIFQDSYEYPFEYTRFSNLYPDLRNGSTTSFLLLGGGAYTIPRTLVANNPDLIVDVAELEPSLFPLAQKYFDLSDVSRIRNHVVDARVYVEQSDDQFDYIFMDTFNSGLYIPAHLTTQEFFHSVRERLTDDGLLMINFIGARGLPGTTLTDSFTATLQSVFPNARAYTLKPEDIGGIENIIFIADATDEPLVTEGVQVSTIHDGFVAIDELEIALNTSAPHEQVIFTDDLSPAEYLVAKQIAATHNKTRLCGFCYLLKK
ncbi:fused MFS/spermidine synthase [Patescibacteria group bacterium]|nr:fused MFS/spermidine synthase [Patescibacteria group bacterium]